MADEPNNAQDDDFKRFLEENLGDAFKKAEEEYKEEVNFEKKAFNDHLDGLVKNLPEDAKIMFKTLFGEIAGVSDSDDDKSILNKSLVLQIAHEKLGSDANKSILAATAEEYVKAFKNASLWLDSATDFAPSTSEMSYSNGHSSGLKILRPVDWVDDSYSGWESFITPIASSTSDSMKQTMHEQLKEIQDMNNGEIPNEIQQMFEVRLGGMGAKIPVFGDQSTLDNAISKVNRTTASANVAAALSTLASTVTVGSYFAIPLFGDSQVVIPQNIEKFIVENASADRNDIVSYFALKESGANRLFHNVKWLNGHLISLIDAYASKVHFNLSDIQEVVSDIDPTDIESLKAAIKENSFEPKLTSEQEIVLSNIRATIALIEGWICNLVIRAGASNLKNIGLIREIMLRDLVAQDPAASALIRIIGVTVGKIEYTKAISFWEKAYQTLGAQNAENLWKHPDNLPNEDALKSTEGIDKFFAGDESVKGSKSLIGDIKIETDWNDLLK